MYLNKKQSEAIKIAIEALEMGCCHNIQPEESGDAIGILSDMLLKSAKSRQKRKETGGF